MASGISTGSGPMAYVRNLRLCRVRHDLLDPARNDDSVSSAARRWSFTHMGQFSHDYRALFGEMPSNDAGGASARGESARGPALVARAARRGPRASIARAGRRRALEKHPLVVRGKLAQVAEATIERHFRDTALRGAARLQAAADLSEPQHLDVLERRQADEIAKSVLERARLQVRVPAQLGQRHGFGEVFVDEAAHALHRHAPPRQRRHFVVGTLRIRHRGRNQDSKRACKRECGMRIARRHSTLPASARRSSENPNPRDHRRAHTSVAGADARAMPRRPEMR